ncbi:restriction endonuclease [Streptomyces sp. TG1A-8]|uniref:restriction endonuclease n=1 Tax=Streptomyces sp. TG1A-8 TaxID=3051385 RepID=UPI00265C1853|nr:restriction endonuclease [Streptomyces sp. TG1A-8]MDO0926085.1 restriction endonuclease [Streptomyces sp. TG1A-8]
MTVPSGPVRRMDRERRFDLRTTALFFLLLAILLCVLAFVVRTAADIVERRPFWAGSLLVIGVAAALLGRSRWRRFSAARCARRAAEALEEAAERAADGLGGTTAYEAAPAGAPQAGAVPVGAVPGQRRPVADAAWGAGAPPVPDGVEPTVVLDHPVDYTELDPDGFEQAIADLCARDECREVEVVGGACDLGADVVAVTPDGRRVIIQCKRYGDANKVGSQDMQRFGGTCFTVHGADVAALVTTSDFTAPALDYAQQCGIVCVNGEELAAWRDGSGPSPWERAGVGA